MNMYSILESANSNLVAMVPLLCFVFRPEVRECVRNLDLQVQVHPGELLVSNQRVHIKTDAC